MSIDDPWRQLCSVGVLLHIARVVLFAINVGHVQIVDANMWAVATRPRLEIRGRPVCSSCHVLCTLAQGYVLFEYSVLLLTFVQYDRRVDRTLQLILLIGPDKRSLPLGLLDQVVQSVPWPRVRS